MLQQGFHERHQPISNHMFFSNIKLNEFYSTNLMLFDFFKIKFLFLEIVFF